MQDIYQANKIYEMLTHAASYILKPTPFSPSDMIINALEAATHFCGRSASISYCRAIFKLQYAQNSSYWEDAP